MTSRIVIIGDTHLQSTNARNVDRLRAFDQIIREGSALERLGAWVHVGDVFHARSTPDDRNAVAERLQAMGNRAPVVILYGNHESPTDLHVFGRLKAGYPIYIIDQQTTLSVRLATSEMAAIACLPFPMKGVLTAQGVAPGDVQAVAVDLLDPVFMLFAAELSAARDRGEVTLMVGHATITGALSSVGQPMGQHGEIVVTRGHLDRLGATPKIFGHIHKSQEIHGAVIVGSSARMDYGETEEKRYLTVASDGTIESHPIDCPPRYHVEGDLTRDGFTWAVTAGPGGDVQPAPDTWKGAEVRVRYRFKASEKGTLAQAQVLATFADAARLEVEPIAVPDRAIRAPEVAAARTVAEKLAAYAKVEQLAPSVAAKLAALEHGDSLTLLTTVQTDLAGIETDRAVNIWPIEQVLAAMGLSEEKSTVAP